MTEWVPGSGFTQDLARRMLYTGTLEDLSGASILSDFRSLGYEIRTQTFYDIRREILGLQLHEEGIVAQQADQRVARAYFTNTDWDISDRFMYTVRVFGADRLTGEDSEYFISVTSNTELTKDTIQAMAVSETVGEEGSGPVEARAAEVFQAFKKRSYDF